MPKCATFRDWTFLNLSDAQNEDKLLMKPDFSNIIITGSRDGAVVRALASHQCVPGSIPGPGVICWLSLLLVLFSAPRGFSPGTPVFPSPQKPTFPNSNSILECTDISERVLMNSLVLRG